MRVAHVVRQYLPSIGGMEEVVRSLAQHQLKSGLQPYIITLNKVFRDTENVLPSSEVIDGVPVYRLPYYGSERYPITPSVLSHIRQADIVHVHGIDFFYDFLALTSFIHRKPLIACTHGGFFHTSFASRLKKIYFNTITRASSLAYKSIVSTSENDGALFRQIISSPKLSVIENGVDIVKFNNAASPTKQPTLLYFGRWSSNKGLLKAIDVLAELIKTDPATEWQFIITGREYDLDKTTLSEYATAKGVVHRLRIVSNPSTDEIKTLINQASYFICLSAHEGFGIAPIEAMSAGLYPLLSNIPPFKRLVAQTNMGVIFEDANPSVIAKHISEIHHDITIDQDELIRAVAPYSWEGVGNAYQNQYAKIRSL